ncbi:AEC family transporter [Agromyces protaetiae]|nr:AEC family transporter [Agromyces protaetiae]
MALLPVFFVMALGYASGRTKLIDNRDIGGLNTLVMQIALPISLFAILASSKRSDVLSHWSMALIVLVVMTVVYAGVYVLQRRVYRMGRGDAAIQAITVAFPNTAAVGLPLADSVLGQTGGLAVAVSLAVGSIVLSPITIVLLEREKAKGASDASGPNHVLRHAIAVSLRKPIVIGPLAGLAWTLAGLPFPALVDATLDEIGAVTGGLALFLTGLVLSAQRIRVTGEVLVGSLLSIVVRPAIAIGIVLAVGVSGAVAQETVLLLAVPSGFFGILLGLGYGKQPDVAGSTLLVSSVGSIATLAAVIVLLPNL